MKPNLQLLQQILDIAAASKEKYFQASDLFFLSVQNQDELIDHLDYLTDKGFIIGEFMPTSFATLGISAQSVRFIRGKITHRGQEYLAGLKAQQPMMMMTA